MEHWYVLWRMGKARHQDLLRQAQQFRLIQEASRSAKRYTPGYAFFLGRLGEQLISWGSYLRNRFPPPGRQDPYAGSVKNR